MKYLFLGGVGAIGLGVVLILIAGVWSLAFPSHMVWDAEQAASYEQASLKYHSDQFDRKLDSGSLQQTRADYQSHRERLESAIAMNDKAPVYLRYIGATLATVGAILLLVHRSI